MGLILSLLSRISMLMWVSVALLAWGGYERHRATTLKKEVTALKQEKKEAQDDVQTIKSQQVKSNLEIARAYVTSIQANSGSRASSVDELGRLRVAMAAAPGCAASAAAAGRADAAAVYATIAGECATALQKVGEDALADRTKLESLQAWARALLPAPQAGP